jgi:hypothetical protein
MSEKEVSKKTLSNEEIYKVSTLNAEGKLTAIYIFCANMCDETHLPELFSDTQLAYFDAEGVNIIFTKEGLIHQDDSILMVKRKIARELSDHVGKKTSVEEMYLFSFAQTFLDMNEIYQESTKNESVPFTKEAFFHYALNLNIDPFSTPEVEDEEVAAKRDLPSDIMANSAIHRAPTYEMWMELQSSGFYEIGVSLGLRFKQRKQ